MNRKRHEIGFRWVGFAAAVLAFTCSGCDQFAAIGIEDPVSSAGAPSLPQRDAGRKAERDASMEDAASARDGGTDHDASTIGDAAAGKDAGTSNDAGAKCQQADVAVCNPVTNEGCEASLMMQCAVDFNAMLAGYCIFNSGGPPPALGGACLNTGVTESCPPTSSCVTGTCRKLCLCNRDCDAGQCCKEPLDTTGFSVCGDC